MLCRRTTAAASDGVESQRPPLRWLPEHPRLRVGRLVAAWLAAALGLLLAAGLVPGAVVGGFGGAVAVPAIVALLNVVLPPVIAALRLPFTVAIGFVLV